MVALDLHPIDDELGHVLIRQVAGATTEFVKDPEIRRAARLVRLKREIRPVHDELVRLQFLRAHFNIAAFFLVGNAVAPEGAQLK